MDTTNIERLLETLIDEVRELKNVVKIATEVEMVYIRKDLYETKVAAQEISVELDWWSKDKSSFAKQVLNALDRIETR